MDYKEDLSKKGLLDTLHSCLVCESPAFEVEQDHYKCSSKDCNFEWKVNRCE